MQSIGGTKLAPKHFWLVRSNHHIAGINMWWCEVGDYFFLCLFCCFSFVCESTEVVNCMFIAQ